MSYYDIQPGEVLLPYHNIGTNAATIDAALAAKAGRGDRGDLVRRMAEGAAADYPLRHSSGKNLNELADVCIDDYNPLGDGGWSCRIRYAIAPISNIVDFYCHRLEIRVRQGMPGPGVQLPIWHSANVPGGDEANPE